MNIDDKCFIAQTANAKILRDVTSVCGECYRDLYAGEAIYYDLKAYRYLCKACAEHLSEATDETFTIVEGSERTLFDETL
jgi:hypothetical protein